MTKKTVSDKSAAIKKSRAVDAYDHADKSRLNNPAAGVARYDDAAEATTHYKFDPHFDPTLDWTGKAEGLSFNVPAQSIHTLEIINAAKILRNVISNKKIVSAQIDLFNPDPYDQLLQRQAALEFYQHDRHWTNRLIAGDSLVVMNSLLQKENLGGKVQMIYVDPPYGIKYGSNFQPFINKRDVKDKDDDLTNEPEMIKAFRDTWQLGIHSYLTYLRNRLLLARELLTDSGSVFVQISDENVHHIREILDEVFGVKNFVTQIKFQKTGSMISNLIASTTDYIIWYAKDKSQIKYHQLFVERKPGDPSLDRYDYVEYADGTIERVTPNSIELNIENSPRRFRYITLTSDLSSSTPQKFEFMGEIFYPPANKHWVTSIDGLNRLADAGRIFKSKKTLRYKRYLDDFPMMRLGDIWTDLGGAVNPVYVVQTSTKAIQRCILMTTDPGDLVFDMTCGSGTTAYVAEQWGRRWITCDTSRVAIEIAKARLMTSTFDYYKLTDEVYGVSKGFIYKTVPHVTLKSIANNEPAPREILYDQPEIDKRRVRVSGPFSVESLPAPIVRSPDRASELDELEMSTRHAEWTDELKATGIIGRGGARLDFSDIETLSATKYLQAEAQTSDGKTALICFGSETKELDSRMVKLALDEAEKWRPAPSYVIFAAFQFSAEAASLIDETRWRGVTLLKVQMNTDLLTDDLKKQQRSSQSFWLVGQPDVELIRVDDDDHYKVIVHGFDYFDVASGRVISGESNNIAMWMLDTCYDGLMVAPDQVFFPMESFGGWTRLKKTLRAEIDEDLIEQYRGNESLPFEATLGTEVAVKIIDDRGIESMRVLKVGDVI